jgi:hypothetical protein
MAIGGGIVLLGGVGLGVVAFRMRPILEAVGEIENRQIWRGSASETPARFTMESGRGTVGTVWWKGSRPTGFSLSDSGGGDPFRPLDESQEVEVSTLSLLGTFDSSGGEYTVTFAANGAKGAKGAEVYVLPFAAADWEAAEWGARGFLGGCCSMGGGGFLAILGLVLGLALRKKR